ncbi:MAG: ribosome small subunit-dependent GTPase A [Pseudomonadota bacterium]|nr:ribosome small subunit-dependent GTPase A [Pseudomonadota bacterium]
MIEINAALLRGIGLTVDLADSARSLHEDDLDDVCVPTRLHRVAAVHRETLQLHDGFAEFTARVLPRLTRILLDAGDAIAVGDWVLSRDLGDGASWVHALVPPRSRIVRRDGDGSRHVVVSNVDRALLVMGLDDDFNLRRLERYLALCHASGVAVLVVLTKADIAAADPVRRDSRRAALRARLGDELEVLVVDATEAAAAARFGHVIGLGQTLVLLGSSGAGKSTLTNALLGRIAQDTGAVRAHDSRGMHTTTARTLHRIEGGACIIDTPGLRTLRVDADAATLAASFADVETLAGQCRFRDCTHGDEPGCAVRAAVDPDRLRNFKKLLRETRRDSLGYVERRQQLASWKSRGKAVRERMRLKRGDAGR